MKLKYRNIISFNLLLLILLSSIGFNIISTMCDGCENEHTSIAITKVEENLSCKCCSVDENEMSCCNSESNNEDDHHQSSSVFAKLNFDSPKAKAKTFVSEIPVLLLHHVTFLFNVEPVTSETIFRSTINHSPFKAGRILLTLICVLLN